MCVNDFVYRYIKQNIKSTIKNSYKELKPVVSPCIKKGFTTFFYWDTYFTNLAFLALKDYVQVKNNLDNMKFMVETMGYIPNEYAPNNKDAGMNRSQPPLFFMCVYDYYTHVKDISVIKNYLPALEAEYNFWQTERTTPCGLNRYWHNATEEYLLNFCNGICSRLKIPIKMYKNKLEQGKHFVAIAESGWDFTPRFYEDSNPYAGGNYAPVDLNSILFGMEKTLSYFNKLLGNVKKAKYYENCSITRKALMDKFMLSTDGIYYDYNFVTNKLSPVLSGASCLPYTMGVCNDKTSLESVITRLEKAFGLPVCEKLPYENHDQWAYPSIWPPITYFAYVALKNVNSMHSKPFAQKYINTVKTTFDKTGRLWEKYDAEKGGVAIGTEYQTPEMFGWTAGVYVYLLNEIKN